MTEASCFGIWVNQHIFSADFVSRTLLTQQDNTRKGRKLEARGEKGQNNKKRGLRNFVTLKKVCKPLNVGDKRRFRDM